MVYYSRLWINKKINVLGKYNFHNKIIISYIMPPKIIAAKLKNYFIHNAQTPALLYNNKITAHEGTLINYFELMSTKTM